MKTIQNISVVEDVTLVSLNDSPADMNTISKIFDMISTNNIDVDMISQTPPHSNKPHLSFTVSGDDLGKILELSAKIRDLYPDVKLSVSNGNCKISVFGEAMKGQPGVAAKVFAAAAKANTDIIMITTSEVDISMLVPQSDLTATLESIKGVLLTIKLLQTIKNACIFIKRFLLSFILFVNPFSDFIIKPSSPFFNPLACFGADKKDFCVWVSVLDIFLALFNIEIKIR
jgi:ACT domain